MNVYAIMTTMAKAIILYHGGQFLIGRRRIDNNVTVSNTAVSVIPLILGQTIMQSAQNNI